MGIEGNGSDVYLSENTCGQCMPTRGARAPMFCLHIVMSLMPLVFF